MANAHIERIGHRRRTGAVSAGLIATAIAVALTVTATPATGAVTTPPVPWAGPVLAKSLVTRAQPDECFQSIGAGGPAISPTGACPSGYQPKVNGAYVWSGARSGDYAYFGTGANVLCLASVEFGGMVYQSEYGACEGAKGSGAATYPPRLGDARKPQVFQVDSRTGGVRDVTPNDPLLNRAIGLRGAAAHNGVVLFFGQVPAPALSTLPQGLGVFAFDGRTGAFLGSKLETTYGALRLGVVGSDGNLYLGAREATGVTGRVLKWTGDRSNPFQYEVVGILPNNDAANLTEHNGRLVVSAWGHRQSAIGGVILGGPMKIWLGPALRAGGLTTADQNKWEPIFSYADYDPDPVVARSIEWGELYSWRGDLYVGTMQVDGPSPTQSTLWAAYGKPASAADQARDLVKVMRPTVVFRIKNATDAAKRKVELLYGSKTLPVYSPVTKKWTDQPNKLGQTPKFGQAGFGNPFNLYTWRIWAFKDRLYFGTFDATGTALVASPFFTDKMGPATAKLAGKLVLPTVEKIYGGADVWRMDGPNLRAVPEDLHGLGNRSNHGVRVIIPFDDKGFFYLGTASSYNLRAGGTNPGGWEFLKVTEGKKRLPLIAPVMPKTLTDTGLVPTLGLK